MEKEEDMAKILTTLIAKIDELTSAINDNKVSAKEEMETAKEEIETSKDEIEISKEEVKLIERLTSKIEDLTSEIRCKKIIAEDKIKENPIAYTLGAFVGGLSVGLLLRKGKEEK